MKPRSSISSTAAVASSKYGSNNTCGGSSINSIFSPSGTATGPVKEGLVSQIASKFQQQVGVTNIAENEIEKFSAKRKISEPIKSVHKYNSTNLPPIVSENSGHISGSGDSIFGSQIKDSQFHATSYRKPSTPRTDHFSNNNKTDSHQARFHNARAMFEKMGSADDLDSIPASPTANIPSISSTAKNTRALSVGCKPVVPDHLINNKFNFSNTSSVTSSYNSNRGIRSRSTSPFGGSRSSSQSSLKQSTYHPMPDSSGIVRSSSGNFIERTSTTSAPTTSTCSNSSSNGNMTVKSSSSEVNGESKSINGHISKSLYNDRDKESINMTDKSAILGKENVFKNRSEIQNEFDNSKLLESKSRKPSDYKSPYTSNINEEPTGPKTSIGSIGRPNIKELTHKQRNWFSNFERGKTSTSASTSGTVTPENVESARRTSVKNDNIPNLLSGLDKRGDKSEMISKISVPDATPTRSANLNLPGDRRPLNALSSCSSDSIEDYIKNWKGDANPESLVVQVGSPNINTKDKSELSSANATPQSSGPSSLNSDSRHGRPNREEKQFDQLKKSKDLSPRSNEKTFRPPVLSPKPNPDVVKRFSFNKNKQSEPNSLNSNSYDEMPKSRSIQNKYDNSIASLGAADKSTKSLNQCSRTTVEGGIVGLRKVGIPNKSKIEPQKSPDGKSLSGSIVRKLSAEYNSKIQQEDITLPKSTVLPTSVTTKKTTSITESNPRIQANLGTENSQYVSSKDTIKKSSSINSCAPIECSNGVKQKSENCDAIDLNESIMNGLEKPNHSNMKSKYYSDFSLEEEECNEIDEEFDKLASETECAELDRICKN